jgi:uncharacterized protein YndB with AHSA1/START domain
MERKTSVHAEDGKQELVITREFDLPLELLFKAYVEPDLIAQWMGTNVLKLDSKKHGSYQFETTDAQGNTYGFHGVIHECSPNQQITRTFEMGNASASTAQFGVQLELLTFEKLTDNTSKLTMHIVYESVVNRDKVLKMGMTQGINRAHNRLQNIVQTVS